MREGFSSRKTCSERYLFVPRSENALSQINRDMKRDDAALLPDGAIAENASPHLCSEAGPICPGQSHRSERAEIQVFVAQSGFRKTMWPDLALSLDRGIDWI
jgi:hypothetical protein